MAKKKKKDKDSRVKFRGEVIPKKLLTKVRLDPTKAIKSIAEGTDPRLVREDRSDQFQEEFRKELKFLDKSSIL